MEKERRFVDPAWSLFGEHPYLHYLKEIGKVAETGICPTIDMRKKKGEK